MKNERNPRPSSDGATEKLTYLTKMDSNSKLSGVVNASIVQLGDTRDQSIIYCW